MTGQAARAGEPHVRPARPWGRLAVALGLALAVSFLLRPGWTTGWRPLLARTLTLGFAGVVAFSLFERWPRRLPAWLARWLLQVVAVGVAMPATTLAIYLLTTPAGAPPFWRDQLRLNGFLLLSFFGLLVAPWTALGALLRQTEAFAREQALAFELERSELEKKALDARLRLLQRQVAPHFLFNTLANVKALVDAESPRAPAVLESLIAYLRAAVPLLEEPDATLGHELELVKAYLDLMRMRIPDRLHYGLHVDDAARGVHCPPTAVLTLVENAVRHGIDPSEEGGRIDIDVEVRGGRCLIRVRDTGVGLGSSGAGLGTGLQTLRERLQLTYRGNARLHVAAREPRGVCAEVEIPAAAGSPA